MTESETPQSLLPIIELPSADIEVGNTLVTVRSLSRAAALKVTAGFDRKHVDDAEIFILSEGVPGLTKAQAAKWRSSTDPVTVGKVVDKIIELSGMAGVSGEAEKEDEA